MPQFEPFTLVLQWNSVVVILTFTLIGLACYVLPLIIKAQIARIHISV